MIQTQLEAILNGPSRTHQTQRTQNLDNILELFQQLFLNICNQIKNSFKGGMINEFCLNHLFESLSDYQT